MKDRAKILGNTAGKGGGGVWVHKGGYTYSHTSFTMEGNAEVSGNTAGTYGGGVWVHDGGKFTLKGGTVESDNSAVNGNSLYVETGMAKWGDSSTNISGGGGSGTKGDNILSGSANSGTNDTLSAMEPAP